MSDWYLSFNPFFIRASVYCNDESVSAAVCSMSFNPFFIRASVYCPPAHDVSQWDVFRFNPFFIRASVYWVSTLDCFSSPTMFQSLLHQGISLLCMVTKWREAPLRCSFNPFFIRASVYWPSPGWMDYAPERYGFNPFFIRASVYCVEELEKGHGFVALFQSLLHQGISLLISRCHSCNKVFTDPFQSLLHQGISLLAGKSG